ncbi:heat-inducible transcriptional repressor HrcA [Schleiferilactobacillus perolens]|jgi:heat-inducible transcriptional repressor|uniref:heat-inducible transcriptional repressor HrcA n=1 Tax=Schleiferilactobacillus perolens TaxID=100468 RepID=UPI002354D8D1|nr:heat-inducible transcriptional repressor HrcA [Schleiferilactobacillus perolens]MCI1892111.1 heat-inducible transcriptional repressor HrcA [Schleiferilactobacillus harbinensis]MCI1911711.1 heat-inducible transcriptional repressor HrcA [Schleiferilactobacillus harbinensis]MCI2171744.1 heat-inducible transcriptional repressor HrcA [Schleiferilactobacillus perolens]
MLTKREMLVLKEIIRHYNESGQPVGSKTIMGTLPMKVSSATIRNDMAALENAGLIEKTHSSSGRVPSDQGYRYYLDHLLQPAMVNPEDLNMIQQIFHQKFYQGDDLVAQSAKILSELTHYTAITLGPEVNNLRLSGFQLMPLGNRRVLALLITTSGQVVNKTFVIPDTVTGEQLEAVMRVINDTLVGKPISTVMNQLDTHLVPLISRYIHSPDFFLDVVHRILNEANADRFHISGKMNILDYAQMDDVDQLKSLYHLIDTEDQLTALLSLDDTTNEPSEHGVTVRLGHEFPNQLLSHMSLIRATYHAGEYGDGIIAILGPSSMPYSRVIGLLDLFRDELARRIADYYRDHD